MAELPSGTVTFLFTDITGSTARWEGHPEAMRTALARHDALLRAAIEGHGGFVVKTMGDAFHAAFARAPDAVAATIDAQRRLRDEPWGEVGPLRVRMALHTGAAEERDGDYYGPPLNRAARLLNAGHGGQVLLSQVTAELVRDSLPSGVRLLDLGRHRLKDLTEPERVSQIVTPDLPSDFPPLASLDARPHNLPTHPTALLGRERELLEIRKLFCDAARLVTLTGPGGTGKTRLGLQVAADLLDDYEHGVFFVELAPITDAALVPSTIAQVLGVRDVGSRPVVDALKEFLRERSVLLLLDNIEQILPAAPVVSDLLPACPGLNVLATSREPLRVRGEHEYAVQPLMLPDSRHETSPETIARYPAVGLFVERARSVRGDFALTDENAAAVAEICRRLDGLPLAIELASARVRFLPPKAIAQRLERRLPLLTGGARDLPTRQQTLRNAIDWSYDLLSGTDQALFRRLGVFVGGFTLEAAEIVCQTRDLDLVVVDGVESLVSKSLVRPQAGLEGEPRFVLLETIREYALEQLEASGELSAQCRGHAEYFLALADEGESKSGGAQQRAWLERLEAEHDNFRAALGRTLVAPPGGDAAATSPLGLRLAAALWQFWFVHGHFREGRRWFGLALASNPGAPPSLRAKALHSAGQLSQQLSDFRDALAMQTEALGLFREVGDSRSAAWALVGIGFAKCDQGDDTSAETLFEEALALFRDLGDGWGVGWSLQGLGKVAHVRGDHPRVDALLTEALDVFDGLGDKRGDAWVSLSLANDLRIRGDHHRARQLLDGALTSFQALGNKQGAVHAMTTLGLLAHHRGDYGLAATLHRQALRLVREVGDSRGTCLCLEGLAALACAQRQYDRAARLFGAVRGLRQTAQVPYLAPAGRVSYAHDLAQARACADKAAFEAAWVEGQAMTLEHAIAYALDEPIRA